MRFPLSFLQRFCSFSEDCSAYFIALPTGLKFLIDMGKNLEIETLISVSRRFQSCLRTYRGNGRRF